MSERACVPLRDLAEVCGISSCTLLNHYLPEAWAVPRDWHLVHGTSTVMVTIVSVPELATELATNGQRAAAVALRRWYEGSLVTAEMERPLALITKDVVVRAVDVVPERTKPGWARKWEDEHQS